MAEENVTRRWFVLDINPDPWAIGDLGVGRNNGKIRPYVGRNQQLWNFQKAVKEYVEDVLKDKPEWNYLEPGKFRMTFLFWRRIDEYKSVQARTHRSHEADLTNLVKATEDACQGLLYKNDKDDIHQENYLVDQGPDVKGRIIFWVEPAPDLPEILNTLPPEVYEILSELDNEFPSFEGPDDDPWLHSEVGF